MFIRTSCLECGCLETYSRPSCWPKILNTFMTWHILQVLSHKDTKSQDKQLYMYNVKFKKMANHGSLKFSLKNKFSFLMTLIRVTYSNIPYLLVFFVFKVILFIYYIYFRSIIFAFTARIYFNLPRILCYSYSFGRNFPNSKSMLSMKLPILEKNLCSHMYVSKQMKNLKCKTKSRQNINYIDDELVCRRKNYSSDRQIRNKRTRYRRIRNRRTRNRRTRNRRTLNRRTRNRRTRNRRIRNRQIRNRRTRK